MFKLLLRSSLTLLISLFLTDCVTAQESAEFSMRGTVFSSFPVSTTEQRALVHVAQQNAYWITCGPSCANDLANATGSCTDIWGDLLGDFAVPPNSHEYLIGDVVQSPSDCTTQRNLFLFIGHITGYSPPSSSLSGRTEFDMSVNSQTFHVLCPLGSTTCASAVSQALLFNRCTAVYGDMPFVLLGGSSEGDTFVQNQSVGIQVFNRTDC